MSLRSDHCPLINLQMKIRDMCMYVEIFICVFTDQTTSFATFLHYKAFEAGTTLIINVIKLFDSNTFIQRGIIFPQTFTYMYILIVIIFCRYADK